MEYFSITQTEQGFHVEGFPDAVKVVRLLGPMSRRLGDLALHKSDLDFSLECLDAINDVAEDKWVLRQALWRSAVIHFAKCFGGSRARSQLSVKRVYSGDVGAMEPFRYFLSLRNKHMVHDENPYSQCLPGAVLNRRGVTPKIAKVACLGIVGDTLSQGNFSNLHRLVTRARDWVIAQFDLLCDALSAELEQEPYDLLVARAPVAYRPPGVEDAHLARDQA